MRQFLRSAVPPGARRQPTVFGYTEPDNDDNSIAIDEEGFYKREHYGITGTLEWEIGNNMRLVSITDWQDFDKNYLEDTHGTPAPLFTFSPGYG